MKTKQSNLSARDRAAAAIMRVNSVPVARPTAPAVDTEAVAAAQDQARADRLKAAAARHVANSRQLDEVMANSSSREVQEVTRRVMHNPKWGANDIDSGLAYSDELEQLRGEQNQ